MDSVKTAETSFSRESLGVRLIVIAQNGRSDADKEMEDLKMKQNYVLK